MSKFFTYTMLPASVLMAAATAFLYWFFPMEATGVYLIQKEWECMARIEQSVISVHRDGTQTPHKYLLCSEWKRR